MNYKQKEIVWVPFPFSDLTNIKKRPVLIVSNSEFNSRNEDVVVCAITSAIYQDDYSVNIDNDSLEYGVLPVSSVIKTHKLFTIARTKIIKIFSIINDECFEALVSRIKHLINFKIIH